MSERLADGRDLVRSLIGDQAGAWDVAGRVPEEPLRELGTRGLLCAQVPDDYGGVGATSLDNGEFTAHVGTLCSSVRSVMTSQGMAAWTIQRIADARQRRAFLPELTSGKIAAVAFSEPDAGSDLSALSTEISSDGSTAVLNGRKKWITAAVYADLLVVFGQYGDGAGAVVVPTSAPGVHVEPVADPLGCRAAGHADLRFDSVRVPADHVLGGTEFSLQLLVTTALAYGRMSVAWGCTGILRACLNTTALHAKSREQFGKRLVDHQLVGRHLADLFAAEQISTRTCEHASRCWDDGSPDMVAAAVLAKYVAATHAAQGAASAMQVMASAGATDRHVVARAYRDSKLMEIIEGSSEICQVILAQHAASTV